MNPDPSWRKQEGFPSSQGSFSQIVFNSICNSSFKGLWTQGYANFMEKKIHAMIDLAIFCY